MIKVYINNELYITFETQEQLDKFFQRWENTSEQITIEYEEESDF